MRRRKSNPPEEAHLLQRLKPTRFFTAPCISRKRRQESHTPTKCIVRGSQPRLKSSHRDTKDTEEDVGCPSRLFAPSSVLPASAARSPTPDARRRSQLKTENWKLKTPPGFTLHLTLISSTQFYAQRRKLLVSRHFNRSGVARVSTISATRTVLGFPAGQTGAHLGRDIRDSFLDRSVQLATVESVR